MSPPMFRKRRRRVALRNQAEPAILTKPKDTELGLTNAHGLFQHRLKYRRGVAGRAADHLQNFGGGGLLLERLIQLVLEQRNLPGIGGCRAAPGGGLLLTSAAQRL